MIIFHVKTNQMQPFFFHNVLILEIYFFPQYQS